MDTILIVDDVDINREILREILEPDFLVLEADGGKAALDILFVRQSKPQAVLLDVIMPDIGGFEVLERIKADPMTAQIPVLFITGSDATEDESRGLSAGAADYITKPFEPETVLARLNNHLELCRYRERLENQLVQKNEELIKTHERTLETLATIIEYRSLESGMHIRRTIELTKILIEHLSVSEKFRDKISDDFCNSIVKAVPLHDIGKIGIPDDILLKPGKLTPDEFEIIKRHTEIGSDIIDSISKDAIDLAGYLDCAHEICRSHHERWDGKGYPDSKKGEEIPLAARISSVVDVYDALVSARCYKPAYSHAEALHIMRQSSGTQFDPDVLDVFLEISDIIENATLL